MLFPLFSERQEEGEVSKKWLLIHVVCVITIVAVAVAVAFVIVAYFCDFEHESLKSG